MGDLDDLYWRMSERERYTNKEAKERAYLATAWLRQYATDSRYLARSSGTPLPPCSTPDERRSRGGQALGSQGQRESMAASRWRGYDTEGVAQDGDRRHWRLALDVLCLDRHDGPLDCLIYRSDGAQESVRECESVRE